MKLAPIGVTGEAVSRRSFFTMTSNAVALAGLGTVAASASTDDEGGRLETAIERHRTANAELTKNAELGDRVVNEFEERETTSPTPYETSAGTLFYPHDHSAKAVIYYVDREVPRSIFNKWQARQRETYDRFHPFSNEAQASLEIANEYREQREAENRQHRQTFDADLEAYQAAKRAYGEREAATGINEIDQRSDALTEAEREAWLALVTLPVSNLENARRKASYLFSVELYFSTDDRWTAMMRTPIDDFDNGHRAAPEQSALATLVFSLIGGQGDA